MGGAPIARDLVICAPRTQKARPGCTLFYSQEPSPIVTERLGVGCGEGFLGQGYGLDVVCGRRVLRSVGNMS
jgi:hypothetical protein